MDAIVRDWLHRISQRVLMLLGVGRVAASDDSQSLQFIQAQMSSEEIIDQLQRVADFGFTSRPPVGAELLIAFLSGDRSKGIVIGTMHQPSRLRNLAEGEAALYSQVGQYVWLKNGGIVIEAKGLPVTVNNASVVTVNGTQVIVNASASVQVTAPITTITGDLVVTGGVQANTVNGTVSVTGAGKSLSTHVHGSVTTGVSTSGPPV